MGTTLDEVTEAERRYGPDALETAEALLGFATATQRSRPEDRPAGIEAARRALAIQEAHRGAVHPEVASALECLAMLLWYDAAYEEVQRVAERALAIRELAVPPDEAGIVTNLHFLSEIARLQGDYGTALQRGERARPLIERLQGPVSDPMATHLHSLAEVQAAIGDRDAALRQAERTVEIRREVLPPNDPRLARSLNLLGRLLTDEGELDRAEPLLEQARSIWETSGNPLDTAQALRSLARLSAARGDLARSIQLYRLIVNVQARALGTGHAVVGLTLAELGAMERRQGDLAAARASLGRALEIEEEGNRRSPITLREQALLDQAEGLTEAALKGALEAERISRERFQASSLGLSEREALAHARKRSGGLDLAWSWASSLALGGALEDGAATDLLDESIRSRAMVLDTLATRQRILALHADQETVVKVDALRRARGRVLHLLLEESTEDLAEAERIATRAERALAEKSREYRLELERSRPRLLDVRRALPGGTALVSYFHYEHEGAAYAASVLLPGKEAPRIVPLGDAAEIDADVQAWRALVSKDPRPGGLALNEAAYARTARLLASQVWDPIAPFLRGSTRVLVVPDGMLHGVSLAALVTQSGAYLADTGISFHYLTAERDLVGVDDTPPSAGGVLAVGDPTFGARFDTLPGTRREALEVATRWRPGESVKLLLRDEAEESAVKHLAPSFSVLHLATHAFVDTGGDPYDSPLRVAGLALSKGSSREEDGILTAEEIALLDLRGVQWAVLSACASGGGKLEPGEGILGLSRAFKIAGARTLIVSLWPIEDDATRYWMRGLYDARQVNTTTVDAVQAAMRGVLAEQRRTGATTHPYFWGSFVSIGDWR